MTKEAGFLETVVKDSKTVSTTKTSPNQNEVKTEASLFDSMLKNAQNTQEETTSTQAGVAKEAQENTKATTTQKKTNITQSNQNASIKEEVSLKANKNTSSFLINLYKKLLIAHKLLYHQMRDKVSIKSLKYKILQKKIL